MKYFMLGDTGIEVSRLCFGTLVMGPLQKNLDIREGASLLCGAYEEGVNFVDTAQLYRTYAYVRESMRMSGFRPVIATKSYAYDKTGAETALKEALTDLDVEYIDIFLLHEQESAETIRGHSEALEYYLKKKDEGYIRAVGLSSHTVAAVEAASDIKEIQVIHPMLNVSGLGICGGTRQQMEEAVKKAYLQGKGIYTMKALGGGNLISNFAEAIRYINGFGYMHSVAVGMQNLDELKANCRYLGGDTADDPGEYHEASTGKTLHIDHWCSGCGRCAERCAQRALYLHNGKMTVDVSKCVLCGYCSAYCQDFAIKIH